MICIKINLSSALAARHLSCFSFLSLSWDCCQEDFSLTLGLVLGQGGLSSSPGYRSSPQEVCLCAFSRACCSDLLSNLVFWPCLLACLIWFPDSDLGLWKFEFESVSLVLISGSESEYLWIFDISILNSGSDDLAVVCELWLSVKFHTGLDIWI